jgi:hypothetical protein
VAAQNIVSGGPGDRKTTSSLASLISHDDQGATFSLTGPGTSEVVMHTWALSPTLN